MLKCSSKREKMCVNLAHRQTKSNSNQFVYPDLDGILLDKMIHVPWAGELNSQLIDTLIKYHNYYIAQLLLINRLITPFRQGVVHLKKKLSENKMNQLNFRAE